MQHGHVNWAYVRVCRTKGSGEITLVTFRGLGFRVSS